MALASYVTYLVPTLGEYMYVSGPMNRGVWAREETASLFGG